MFPLSNDERRRLLGLARRALELRLVAGLRDRPVTDSSSFSAALLQRAGVFVSLHQAGELRGCVGQIEPSPLHHAVPQVALAAATRDPRFTPLTAVELPQVEIEISVLTPPRAARMEEIQVGLHGLVVSYGLSRGLLLPQVAAERQWSPRKFLEETCRKAGLDPDLWQRGARVESFEADVFGEKPLAGATPR